MKIKLNNSPLIKCQCSDECQTIINSINSKGKKAKYAQGHNNGYKRKDHKSNKYEYFRKPYYKYSNKWGYVQAHRYIYHIYLSILNNKTTYIPKNIHVHHINGNKKDNRIENLQLLTNSNHTIHHNIGNKRSKKDMLNRICNLCNKKTRITNNNYENWFNDIKGFLCRGCYDMIKYYQNKLFGSVE